MILPTFLTLAYSGGGLPGLIEAIERKHEQGKTVDEIRDALSRIASQESIKRIGTYAYHCMSI